MRCRTNSELDIACLHQEAGGAYWFGPSDWLQDVASEGQQKKNYSNHTSTS
jgi:hypothetical protein